MSAHDVVMLCRLQQRKAPGVNLAAAVQPYYPTYLRLEFTNHALGLGWSLAPFAPVCFRTFSTALFPGSLDVCVLSKKSTY